MKWCIFFSLVAALSCAGNSSKEKTASFAGHWFETCGDPVCSGNDPRGTTACSAAKAGDACSSDGAQCDFGDGCNRRLLCTTTDPTLSGCPKSLMHLKQDIRYLSALDRQKIADQLSRFKLATYRYKGLGQSAPLRLGFMIDDQPNSPAVDAHGDMVDLYGYLSMTVAALQVQADEIAQLKAQVSELQQSRSARR